MNVFLFLCQRASVIRHSKRFRKTWTTLHRPADVTLTMPASIHYTFHSGALLGPLIADAISMPVHWYYDRAALRRDYGVISGYLAPKNPHPDSILWRSTYLSPGPRGDILREQAQYWGQRGIHYHQFLAAGENTLNFQLGRILLTSLVERGKYDADDWLERYLDYLLTPGRHRDTYIEEYHRNFFAKLAKGIAPKKCGGPDIHIGGLAHVPILAAFYAASTSGALAAVREHLALSHRSPEVEQAAVALVKILHAVQGGASLPDAIFAHASDWFSPKKAALWSREADDVVIGRRVSPACYIADAFPASLYLAWKYAGDFSAGVFANAQVGGDNCHRGAVVGSLLGACQSLPETLVAGLFDSAHLQTKIGALVQS